MEFALGTMTYLRSPRIVGRMVRKLSRNNEIRERMNLISRSDLQPKRRDTTTAKGLGWVKLAYKPGSVQG